MQQIQEWKWVEVISEFFFIKSRVLEIYQNFLEFLSFFWLSHLLTIKYDETFFWLKL